MTLLRPLIIAITFSVVGCADNPPQHNETHACMTYRSMMTAPMPATALAELKKRCEQSR